MPKHNPAAYGSSMRTGRKMMSKKRKSAGGKRGKTMRHSTSYKGGTSPK